MRECSEVIAIDDPLVPPGTEQYRRIPGFDLYAAGTDGSIWSCAKSPVWKRLSPGRTKWGYLIVVLSVGRIRKTISVHRLIGMTFLGPLPKGLETRHLDGNPSNNRLSNLQYGTKSQNTIDSFRHGKHPGLKVKREGNPKAKLTEHDVKEIRRLDGMGLSASQIVRTGMFPVHKTTVQRVVSGRLWPINDAAELSQRIRQQAVESCAGVNVRIVE